MFRFSRSGIGEVDGYRFMSNIVQITICFFVTCLATLPLVVNYCSKHSNKPIETPSKLIQILGGGNCLFQALSYAVKQLEKYIIFE